MFRGLNLQRAGGEGWGGVCDMERGRGGGLILGGGGRLLETLSAYVCRDRWEGRESDGEREREPEDPGDLSLRRELRV